MAENNNGSGLDGGAVREVARLAQKVSVYPGEPVHYAVIPNDCTVKSLAEFQYPQGVPPRRIRAQVKLSDAASFAEYVKKFWNPHTTVVFAQPERFSFLAVVDYHCAGTSDIEEAAEFCDHKATFQMAQDERWKIWSSNDNKSMLQADFAEFIEDNMADIFQPPAADMLEIARDLKAKIDVNFGSSVRSQSGQVQLKYEETVKAGVGPAGIIEVPEDFLIHIPVFYGEQPVLIKARLRFRINQGKLSFHYKLNRPLEVQAKAFETAVLGLQQTLGANILLGSPS